MNFMAIKYMRFAHVRIQHGTERNETHKRHTLEKKLHINTRKMQFIWGAQVADIRHFVTHLLRAYFSLINWRNRTLFYSLL